MGNKSSKSTVKLQDLKLKIVLVGDAGSGKSSVVSRVTANQVKDDLNHQSFKILTHFTFIFSSVTTTVKRTV